MWGSTGLMVYGVILAGGRGERFWPRSTKALPKQLLPITSDRPMIVETVERVESVIPRDKIIVVAGKEHEKPIKKLLPNVRVLLEPFGRNTVCAIAYGTTTMKSDDVMVVLPADHYIPDKDLFLQTMKKAIKVAKKGWLVTFGIVPTRAETGYGYIEIGEPLEDNVYKVKSFKEKPNHKQAQRFIREGKFLWNSGMFVWTKDKILSEIRTHMSEFYQEFDKFRTNKSSLLNFYNKAPNISIDYAVMEKSNNVAVVKSEFLWDDIGTWIALERIYKSDTNGNIKIGFHKGIDTKNCIIVADKGIISTIGISNLIIVRNGDAIFICDKKAIGEIKGLIRHLSQDNNFKKYL